jgi:holo-[acyl-carrier protein] synthase
LVVGLGIDVVELAELREGLDDRRLDELYLPAEIDYASTQARSWESLGARLAAKRAVLRALGADQTDAACREVEVVRGELGELDVRLHGGAKERARVLSVRVCLLSMTHTRATALAIAVVED